MEGYASAAQEPFQLGSPDLFLVATNEGKLTTPAGEATDIR
jgi:hypothetical protein